MNHKLNQLLIASLLAVGIISLSACSSDDDDKSPTSNATGTVTNDNARSLVIASAQGTSTQQQAGELSTTDLGATLQTAFATNTAGTDTNLGFILCGGENGTAVISGFQTSPSGSVTFNNYCVVLPNPGAVSEQFTLNGVLMLNISGIETPNFSVLISFSNFSATYNNVTTQIDGSITINNSGTTNNIVINDTTDITSEGQAFQIGDLSAIVYQDGSIAIDGILTADSMTYDIQSTTPLVFDATCTNGAPTSGVIELIGVNGSSATANFATESCNTFRLCVVNDAGIALPCTPEPWAR